ncbi:Subtilisin-like protease SBT1.1 [Vitis vinifera]|uniref:Subtilisin-like protease SBT1.1 n=1 Tax=Vitis vinifera TaxID=29760 RepID=A0A438IW93_VITVI|nr:Subtilisin-like protease SBT1.1 [Vitis vinifera]
MFRTSFLLLAFMAAATSIASTDKQTYVVHMDKAKITALRLALGDSKKWYEAVVDSIIELSTQDEEEETSPPQLLYTYETAMTGFAAKLSIKQLQALDKVEGFLSAVPDELLSLHTTHSPQFLGLHKGKGLWSTHNLATDGACEEGTKFTSSNCNKKLIGARAFFKGYEARAGRINETVDYRSARDSQGHGTHTASTAAGDMVAGASIFGMAKGSASGMMYTSRIAAYKVCYIQGCANSDILAAIDQAVSDGVDILSLSLGGASRPYYSDSLAIASFGAVQNGVLVSCSAGNSGPSSSTVSNSAPWIMTIAASSLDRSFPTIVKLGNGETYHGASLYSGKPTHKLLLVYGETAGSQGAEYCTMAHSLLI